MAFPDSFKEIEAPSFVYTWKGITGKRKFKVAVGDLDATLLEIYLIDGTAGSTPSAARILAFPGKEYLLLDQVAVDPLVKPGGHVDSSDVIQTTASSSYLLTLSYKTPDPRNPNDPRPPAGHDPADRWQRYSFSMRGSGQMERFSSPRGGGGGRVFTWDQSLAAGPMDNKVGPGVNIKKMNSMIDLTIGWNRVEFPDWSAISDILGSVNDDVFLLWQAEQVLFSNFSASEVSVPPEGLYEWNIQFNYKIWPRRLPNKDGTFDSAAPDGGFFGWNHMFRHNAVAGADHPFMRTTPLVYEKKSLFSIFEVSDIVDDIRTKFIVQAIDFGV